MIGTFFLVSLGIARGAAVFRAPRPPFLPVFKPAAARLRFWDETFAAVLTTTLDFPAAAGFFPPGREVRFGAVVFLLV
jgi:hypothetical protein